MVFMHAQPDVISPSFISITSLLNGVPGSGFLNHAINLYLRCKYKFSTLQAASNLSMSHFLPIDTKY
jgi:hypothetical protein